ncbi:MAG: zf-HC2 domain-containing protein [Chloroflexi bacterium]|nr:zf-HC2 domain-containing protein [Chloroflexota bacterium]
MTEHPIDHVAARRLIDAYLVDDLDAAGATRLAAHLHGCPACAAELGGSTRVLALLATLSTPRPTPDLDERILVAALADRARRHEHRSWLSDLRTQVLRGAMRTTGTVVVTIVTVALLGGAFVFAATWVGSNLPRFASSDTIRPVATPTLTPTQTAQSTPAPITTPRVTPAASATPVPAAPTASPAPTPTPSASPSPSATPTPSPTPTPTPTPSPTIGPSPTPTATATPTPTPTPSPTVKPRRTPPPSASPAATQGASSSTSP